MSTGPQEHLFKILVVGEIGVGKSSIIKRYVHNIFAQHYKATIGVDFALKVFRMEDGVTVRLQLWDIAGQERFGNMTRVYYKEAVGAIIVYDVTRPVSFEGVKKWKKDIDDKVFLPDGHPIPCVLFGNKADLPAVVPMGAKDMDDFCEEQGFAGWFHTSAKTGDRIDEGARHLVSNILERNSRVPSSKPEGVVRISAPAESEGQKKKKKGCC
jgi:Ras-related protein Rab-32